MSIGPKLNRDWVGLRVELARTTGNSLAELPRGTEGRVDGYTCAGISFLADCCPTCGVRVRITGLRRGDVRILTPMEDWPDTRGQGGRRRR